MKNLLILIFCFLSYNALALDSVEIINAEYPVEDFDHRPTLCLTVVKVPKTGKLLGIVESLEDCFYARKAKKSSSNTMRLPLQSFEKITLPEMKEHLQRLDPQLEFYFSDGE